MVARAESALPASSLNLKYNGYEDDTEVVEVFTVRDKPSTEVLLVPVNSFTFVPQAGNVALPVPLAHSATPESANTAPAADSTITIASIIATKRNFLLEILLIVLFLQKFNSISMFPTMDYSKLKLPVSLFYVFTTL